MRVLGEGKLLMSDSFPGQERSKLCMSSKVCPLLMAWPGACAAVATEGVLLATLCLCCGTAGAGRLQGR